MMAVSINDFAMFSTKKYYHILAIKFEQTVIFKYIIVSNTNYRITNLCSFKTEYVINK